MTNAEYLRRLRAIAEQRGFCRECRARRVEPGYKTCTVCLQAHEDKRNGLPSSRARVRAPGKRQVHRCFACGSQGHNARTCAELRGVA